MPITGHLSIAGRFTVGNSHDDTDDNSEAMWGSWEEDPEDEEDEDDPEVSGIVLEMDDDNLREAAGKFLGKRVVIWSADELGDLRGTSAMEPTPENMQHLAARLAAAEDHLTREVRSNQAAALVRADLERDAGLLRAANASLMDEVTRLAADLTAERTRNATLEKSISKFCEESNASLRAEVDRLTANLKKVTDDMVVRNTDVESLSRSLNRHLAANERMAKIAEDAQREVDRLAAELAEALSDAAELRRRIWVGECCDENC